MELRPERMNCPFCSRMAPTKSVAAPPWFAEERGVEVIIGCHCEACGLMLIDTDGDGSVEPGLQALFDGATTTERVFLAKTNLRWLDEVVYGSWIVRRLLEAHQAASSVLSGFGLANGEVVSSGGGIDHSNVLVLVDSPGGRFTVRVHAPDRNEATVRSEIYWLRQLKSEGLRVPSPVIGVDGSGLQEATIEAGSRFCTAYSWLPGDRLEAIPMEERSAELASSIGQALAEMHLLGLDPELPDWFSRPSYGSSDISGAEECGSDDALLRELDASSPRGLIHHEVGANNIIVHDREASFIDFTTLGWGPLVHDVITVAGEFCQSEMGMLLAAYDTVRPLTDAESTWIQQRLP